MRFIPSIPPAVARKLGYYVYLYVNPLERQVFYVGKGKGGRALAHLEDRDKKEVQKVLRRIRAARKQPEIEILAHGLPDAETALRIEAAAIDVVGVSRLANLVRGKSSGLGRTPLNDLVAHYTRRPARITEAALLVRLNRLYRYGMSDVGLYDASRTAWVVGPNRDKVRLVLSVHEGIVREVYRVTAWLPAGSTFNTRWAHRTRKLDRRWEFVGTIAEKAVRKRYINRYVGHLFAQGAQNPVAYINVDGE